MKTVSVDFLSEQPASTSTQEMTAEGNNDWRASSRVRIEANSNAAAL